MGMPMLGVSQLLRHQRTAIAVPHDLFVAHAVTLAHRLL
jgi:hypothetical protein